MGQYFRAAIRAGIAAGCFWSMATLHAQAGDWLDKRNAAFAQWQAANPNIAAQIEDLKAKTAAMAAASARPKPAEATRDPSAQEDTAVGQPSMTWRVQGAPTQIWDSPEAPLLSVIPAGEYAMGSPVSEPNRYDNEGSRHRVRVGYPFATGINDVTRAEYAAFINDTHYVSRDEAGCDWEHPGFTEGGDDPVVCVSLGDANAYAAWLSRKTGHTYRLLSEAEWEYGARAGTATAYYWGQQVGTGNANCDGCGGAWDNKGPSPVGSLPANPFGLADMAGNVWQWTNDCWDRNYAGAPADGSTRQSGDCGFRMLRGGSWFNFAGVARAASRTWLGASGRSAIVGFRVARTL